MNPSVNQIKITNRPSTHLRDPENDQTKGMKK